MLPSAHINRVGVRVVSFRSSTAHPACTPVYASLSSSRYQRKTRGRSGSLLLSRKALSSSTSCRLSGKAMARTGLRMMPTFPSPPLKFRTAGFPRYGFKAGISDKAFPENPGLPSSFVPTAFTVYSLPCVRDDARFGTSVRADPPALPQGPSLRSGLCCPGPSSLNRPHPPHSRAHPNFAIWWLIRDAIAVPIRIGLGNPRLVLSFH